jgi:G:T-mismatch repair DNA endonuclease (very short patch repair protein)
MSKKLTKKECVDKGNEKHNFQYDYSLVKYIARNVEIKIICPKHGIFEQLPYNHWMGKGCPKCANLKRKNRRRHKFVDFLKLAVRKHGLKYDYSLVNYINNKTKIKIICPNHGIFEQIPYDHFAGKNCLKCAGTYKPNTKEYIQKAEKVHGKSTYDYRYVDYINNQTNIKISCFKHGIFEQNPNNHLNKKYGCPKCGCGKNISKGQRRLFDILQKNNIKATMEHPILTKKTKYIVDIFILEKNIIIEYYGDYWHCNPKKYSEDKIVKQNKKKAGEIWNYDTKRKKELEKLNYKVFIVWESDFKKNKEEIIQNIVKQVV